MLASTALVLLMLKSLVNGLQKIGNNSAIAIVTSAIKATYLLTAWTRGSLR